jgi:hypothetical protein
MTLMGWQTQLAIESLIDIAAELNFCFLVFLAHKLLWHVHEVLDFIEYLLLHFLLL